MLTYACETWTLATKDSEILDTFERKVLRRIIGPICDRGRWRRRYNHELYTIYEDQLIRRIVKSSSLRWAGHVARMNDTEIPNRVLQGKPGGQRVVVDQEPDGKMD